MSLRSFTLICLVITLTGCVVLSNGCRKKTRAPQPVANTAAPATSAEQYHHPDGGTTPTAEVKYFKGSIGNALDLQMKLSRDGLNLTGTYFYQKIGSKIDVRGKIDQDGNLTLEEFDSSGKQTGLFKGIWKAGNDGLVAIAGNWTKPNGDKRTAFSLHEQPIELSGAVEIVPRQIKENNKKLRYEIDIQYPQLSGSTNPNFEKFNQEVKSVVMKNAGEFKKDMSDPERQEVPSETTSYMSIAYTVAMAGDDVISVELDVGSYYMGAAHPNSYSRVVNFDLKNGKPLKLGDLFKPGAKYLQTISAYCIRDLKKQSKERGPDALLEPDEIQSGAGPDAKNYQSWTINKRALEINFDAYQVAPYAAGPQHVSIPYSALKDIINPDGPVGQFAK